MFWFFVDTLRAPKKIWWGHFYRLLVRSVTGSKFKPFSCITRRRLRYSNFWLFISLGIRCCTTLRKSCPRPQKVMLRKFFFHLITKQEHNRNSLEPLEPLVLVLNVASNNHVAKSRQPRRKRTSGGRFSQIRKYPLIGSIIRGWTQ